jgi:hypothetical protein
MSETEKKMATNRFSVVDLLVDIFLLGSIVTIPMRFTFDLFLPKSGTMLSQLLHLGLLFLVYFGIALYVSQIYCATVIRTGKRQPHEVLQQSVNLTAFSGVIIITIILSAALLFRVFTLPPISGSLLIVQALFFGLSLGLDYGIERQRSEDASYRPPKNNIFSKSLSHIPYLALTVGFVFPAEYVLSGMPVSVGAKVLVTILSIVVAIPPAYLLDRLIFRGLLIGARMNAATIAVVSALMIVGFLGIDVLEIVAQNQKEVVVSGIVRVIMLFFVGVVPVRVGILIFSKARLFNRILGAVAVLSFILVQAGVFEIPWIF